MHCMVLESDSKICQKSQKYTKKPNLSLQFVITSRNGDYIDIDILVDPCSEIYLLC